jgi:metal-dependent amidase/aminoacylase/carboxypeptidase family protein
MPRVARRVGHLCACREVLKLGRAESQGEHSGSRRPRRNASAALIVAQTVMDLLRQHHGYEQTAHGVVTRGGATPGIIPAGTSAQCYLRAPHIGSLYQIESSYQMDASVAVTR